MAKKEQIIYSKLEVHRFHPSEPTIKKEMEYSEFLKLKNKNGYIYRAYQIGYNTTII